LAGSSNIRNGSTPKRVGSEIGEVTIEVARDRKGTFPPQLVAKHQRRMAGFDEAVTSLYAKGMTTSDMVAHLEELYYTDVSRDLDSRVTDQVLVAGKDAGLLGLRRQPTRMMSRQLSTGAW
jgi:putative transposase